MGDSAMIGAGSVVLDNVEPDTTVTGPKARVVKRGGRKIAPSFELDQVRLPDPVSQELCRLQVRIERLEAAMRGEQLPYDEEDKCKKESDGGRKMKLYNTLTRRKEEFVPVKEGVASIYSCGPTVYQHAHIGNMRAYVFMDILRRVLRYNGYKLKHVMNITDVGHLVSDADEGEDKMVKTARQAQKSPWEIAEYYTGIFMSDIAELNIEKPEYIPKATEHINEMIEFVKALVDRGYGYETSDGIYFDVMKFKGYGKLSGLDLEGQIAGARIGVNEEKKHPADFALWKKAPKEHIMQWPSPWGWDTRAGT